MAPGHSVSGLHARSVFDPQHLGLPHIDIGGEFKKWGKILLISNPLI